MNKHRSRKRLPHEIPPWVKQGARHFATVNCGKRGYNSLAKEDVYAALLESVAQYEQIGRWYVWLMMVMPDHLHLIATFNLDHGVKPTISAWKRYLARNVGIDWQADFFEHRLRNQAAVTEKSAYARMNPVRGGLTDNADVWPYVFDRTNR